MSGKISSIAYKDVTRPKKDQFTMGTLTGAIPILLAAFVILKLFVYIKDEKRHGQ